MKLSKPDPSFREPIDVWRSHDWMPRATEPTGAVLISHDHYKVGLGHHSHTPSVSLALGTRWVFCLSPLNPIINQGCDDIRALEREEMTGSLDDL